MRAAGGEVRYLGAVLVPDDEMGFHLFAAANLDGVLEATHRAGLRVERVVQALAVGVEAEGPVAHQAGEVGP